MPHDLIPQEDATEIKKRSVMIEGHRTSVSLENVFWGRLRDIALWRNVSVNTLVAEIDATRTANLSCAIRCFVLSEALGAA